MRVYFVLLFSFLSVQCFSAQDFQKGKMYVGSNPVEQIFYDRTQPEPFNGVYQTLYKVYDSRKKMLCSLIIKNNTLTQQFSITVKPENAPSFGSTTKYDRNISGLIFTNEGKPDTSFSMQNHYPFLFSCPDTVLDYMVMHKFILNENQEVELDPLSKNRINRHNEIMIRHLESHPYLRKVMMGKEGEFNQQLLQLRDSFLERELAFTSAVKSLRTEIENLVQEKFSKKKITATTVLYDGEKRKGKPDGKGLLYSNGNIYNGVFSDGKLVKGIVHLHSLDYEYWGNYSNDTFNGNGLLMFTNGNYYLGSMHQGVIDEGVCSWKDDSGETFYGNMQAGLRNGYGEVFKTNGSKSVGQFINGKLVKGYTKETDEFGNTDYFRTEGGKEIDAKATATEKILDTLLNHVSKSLPK